MLRKTLSVLDKKFAYCLFIEGVCFIGFNGKGSQIIVMIIGHCLLRVSLFFLLYICISFIFINKFYIYLSTYLCKAHRVRENNFELNKTRLSNVTSKEAEHEYKTENKVNR